MNNGLLDDIKMILDEKFKEQDTKIDGLSEKFDRLDEKVGHLEQEMVNVKNRLDSVDERLESLEGITKRHEERLVDINLTLENEIIPNIKFIAEGHMDLKRKMDSVMEKNDQMEWMSTHLLKLEMDVKKIMEQKGVAG